MQPENFLETDPFFSRPAHLINRAARMFSRIGERRLKAIGFGVGQLPVLGALKREGRLTQKELAERARIEQPSMAQLLARMKRDGLITFTPDPADKRSRRIGLSERALAGLPAVAEVLFEGNRDALAGFSEEEIAVLAGLLKRVIANLEEMVERDG